MIEHHQLVIFQKAISRVKNLMGQNFDATICFDVLAICVKVVKFFTPNRVLGLYFYFSYVEKYILIIQSDKICSIHFLLLLKKVLYGHHKENEIRIKLEIFCRGGRFRM